MSYIVSFGKHLGLGSSGLALETSWLDADVKFLVLDNGGSLVKGLPVIPCVIEIVPGFGKARNDVNFKARLMPIIGVVYLDTLLTGHMHDASDNSSASISHRAEFKLKLVLLTVVARSRGSM